MKTFPADPGAGWSDAPSTPEPRVGALVEHIFRRESGRLVAILARRLGSEHLHLAEDAVQDALLKAMQAWTFHGIPPNPTAWLLQVARNRAIDQTRRAQVFRGKEDEIVSLVEEAAGDALAVAPPRFEEEIGDNQLRMMFVCCHPGIAPEGKVALVLRTLCGFGEREIAAAFLISEAAASKRLVRARQFLRETGVSFDLPGPGELAARVDAVLQALYLLFNEGYKASHGDSLLRADLCEQSVRLCELLVASPAGDRTAAWALLALMHFGVARLPARVAPDGNMLLLAEQDRSLWDSARIRRGVACLERSGHGDEVSKYHLEAGIAFFHCMARDFRGTNWKEILALYDMLVAVDDSPVVGLNRAVALAMVEGPEAGLDAITRLPRAGALAGYHLFHAVSAQLQSEAGMREAASASFLRALELAGNETEREFLRRRLEALDAADGRPDDSRSH
ncbi:MAG TPA: sigma-70 family RNA polymerase sigma factor [Opitutaceae bacterium]|nr:sigma-70 family RNA polymerase sigma factor [Opitutaceae bacterium]